MALRASWGVLNPRFADVCLLALLVIATTALACGSGDAARGGVTIEPLASQTPTPPAATPTPPPADTPTSEAPEAVEDVPTASPTAAPVVVATPAPAAAPTEGRWIDVDVTNFVVRLMDGTATVQEIAPIGVGVEINTGAYLSTQTGLFAVHTKVEALTYDAPYDTYISHWVGFDAEKDNGFHSLLKDAAGNVVDASTGRVSNGCIRTGGAEALYAFAEIGMPVYVHL